MALKKQILILAALVVCVSTVSAQTSTPSWPNATWSPTGTWSWPNSTWSWPNSTWSWPNGTWSFPNGTWSWPNSTWSFPNGTWSYPNGTWTWPNGTWSWPNSTWSYPNGTWTWPNGTWTYPNGTWTWPNGTWTSNGTWTTAGSTAGPTGGSTAGPTGGSTAGSTAGPTGGSTAGPTGGSTAGPTGTGVLTSTTVASNAIVYVTNYNDIGSVSVNLAENEFVLYRVNITADQVCDDEELIIDVESTGDMSTRVDTYSAFYDCNQVNEATAYTFTWLEDNVFYGAEDTGAMCADYSTTCSTANAPVELGALTDSYELCVMFWCWDAAGCTLSGSADVMIYRQQVIILGVDICGSQPIETFLAFAVALLALFF